MDNKDLFIKLIKSIKEKRSIADIKSIIGDEVLTIEDRQKIIEILCADDRKGLIILKNQLIKKNQLEQKEAERMQKMFLYERSLYEKGYAFVGGIDEVGRGPLIGPVVAAAVVLDPKVDWSGIDDSKKLSEEKRFYFYEKIKSSALSYGFASVDAHIIDEINIYAATKKAMVSAVEKVRVDALLIDAMHLESIDLEQMSLIKGDQKSASIAAASILAKVERDRWMLDLDEKHPEYDFKNNKGYGTPRHYQAIAEHGLLKEHRRSFLKKIIE